jgi:hypothetical protein
MARVEKAKQVVTGKSLADIAKDRQTLDEFVTEQEGELTPELVALFEDHEIERTVKVERIGYIITDEETQIEAIDAQMKRLAARKRAAEGRVEWLKYGYLAPLLMEMGMEPGDKVKGGLATVALQLNNPRLDGDLPETFAREHDGKPFVKYTPASWTVDRVALLTEAKLDESILPDGVKIVRDISVRVR